VKWEEGVLIRFIRLQGKPLIESVYDPALNAVFLAWDVLIPKYARSEWECYRKEKPITDPAYNHRLHWQEIASRPSDPAEAWARLSAIVNQRVGRLKELLARNEAIEAAEADAPDWADLAALDRSPGSERHRRGQSARSREMLQTFNTLCKMRKSEFGAGNGESGMRNAECGMRKETWRRTDSRWRMTNVRWRMTNARWPMTNARCQMADDGCQKADDECQTANDEGQSSGLLTEDSSDPVVGHDSNRVMDDLTNDKIGILSHEREHAAGQPGQGDGAGQDLPESKIENPESKIDEWLPQKAPNEANLKSTQSASLQGVESENGEPPQRERTQFAAGGELVGGAGIDRVETIVPAGKERAGNNLLIFR
jgi:hypothetical protein